MNKVLKGAIALSAMMVAMPAAAQTVFSENFNDGTFGGFTRSAGADIAVATAQPGYVACCQATGSTAALNNPFATFGSGGTANTGSIATTFATVAGKAYNLSFRAGAFGSGTDVLNYSVGALVGTLSLAANNNADTNLVLNSFSFVGTGNPTTLSFGGGAGPNVDAILDDVSISAVPEPATWGMMILGLAAVGGAMRTRRRATLAHA